MSQDQETEEEGKRKKSPTQQQSMGRSKIEENEKKEFIAILLVVKESVTIKMY